MPPGLALIFDMDGVIVDSNPVHREAWRAYNLRFGIPTDEDMLRRMYGKRNDDIVRDFFGTHLSPEAVFEHGAAKERLYRELMSGRVEEWLVPGVREFLARHAGLAIGLASNAEAANVEFLLDAAGLRPYFRAAVDGYMVANPKPHPEIYLRTAQLLGSRPENCIVFEDSPGGIEAARAAGMRVVGVRTTHRAIAGADLEIRDFLDVRLEPWLQQQKPF
ncbi:MAG: HAD family hydrolase [Bryobacteraceae bacterium]